MRKDQAFNIAVLQKLTLFLQLRAVCNMQECERRICICIFLSKFSGCMDTVVVSTQCTALTHFLSTDQVC